MLQTFLKAYKPPARAFASGDAITDPWTSQQQLRAIHDRFCAAAKLYDAGRTDQAKRDLLEILKVAPEYPFAAMLLRIIQSV
jgi:hypothetical protein